MEELLEKLKSQHEEHKKTSGEIESLIQEQIETLKDLLEQYKPVYEWYKENSFVFTHPDFNIHSGTGPILGYIEKENEVIVFNVNKRNFERVYLHDNEERKGYNLYSLVRDGHFETAKTGILYLERMLENYLERNHKTIDKLKSELEEI